MRPEGDGPKMSTTPVLAARGCPQVWLHCTCTGVSVQLHLHTCTCVPQGCICPTGSDSAADIHAPLGVPTTPRRALLRSGCWSLVQVSPPGLPASHRVLALSQPEAAVQPSTPPTQEGRGPALTLPEHQPCGQELSSLRRLCREPGSVVHAGVTNDAQAKGCWRPRGAAEGRSVIACS